MTDKKKDHTGSGTIDTHVKTGDYNPELDPKNPAFDIDKWRAATFEARQGFIEAMNRAREVFAANLEPVYGTAARAAVVRMQDSLEELIGLTTPMIVGVGKDHIWEGSVDAAKKFIEAMREWMDFSSIVFEESELTPYLNEELKKPEYEGRTLSELWDEAKDNGRVENSLFLKAVEAAEAAQAAAGRRLRTAAKAGDILRITQERLALPTEPNFLNAVNLHAAGNAYIAQVNMDGLRFDSGKLFFNDSRAREVSEMELQDLKTKESIESINLPFLQFYYTQLFSQWEKAIQDQAAGKSGEIDPITKFYLPDIASARGLPKNAGTASIEAIKKDVAAFHNVVGVLKEGYASPSYYPVLNFEGYDSKTNTLALSSPYLLHVVETIFKASVRRTKDGTAKLRNDGTPKTKAVNSYLVHSDIQKERNRAAVQNVFILVQGVERCGKNEYTIKAQTLIERNPIFKEQLGRSANQRQLLTRVFKKTWQLLREKTDLREVYADIELPDENNPASIPTQKELSSYVIKIAHKGKVKK